MGHVVEVGQMEIQTDGSQTRGLGLLEFQRRARSLRAEALARTVGAPWRWLRTRVERLRAPIDFEPVEY